MAQTITILPELVTSADANDEILTINEPVFNRMANPIVLIEVVTGTWKFGVGEIASNSSATYGIGEKVDLQLRKVDGPKRPQLKLNIKAANTGETFKISSIGK